MEFTQDQIDIVKKHAAGLDLNKKELQFVEEHGQTDIFEKEFEYQEALITSVTLKERESWKKKFQALDAPDIKVSKDPEVTKKSSMSRYVLFVLGLIALFILGYYIGRSVKKSKSPEVLYAQFYEPFPNIANPLDRNVNPSGIDGFQEYEQGNYDKALDKLSEGKNDADIVQFYRALCYLNLEELEKAVNGLAAVANNENARFRDAAEWYNVLALIKSDQITRAEVILNNILKKSDHLYLKKAEELYQKM